MSKDLAKDPMTGHLIGVENTPEAPYEHQEYPKVVKAHDGTEMIVYNKEQERDITARPSHKKKHDED